MSGTGVTAADSSSVFSPEWTAAGTQFAQSKLSATSVEAMGRLAVTAMRKLCAVPTPMSTGALAVPVTALVAGSVVWNDRLPGMAAGSAIAHPAAIVPPTLMMVAKAVAGAPTWTERLPGNTAATSDWTRHRRRRHRSGHLRIVPGSGIAEHEAGGVATVSADPFQAHTTRGG